ncbi:regulator of chromosome condensation 1/beta-lactamase-inhibitor protein II [Multifurca ochricompacta]|uniref:Regulator of chromosome condensation 1/beta-lactamase-inhibitor protein II n=1 Tax=Multifurca ochricompacta TaxID=376703 RepID=A0AAD4LW43_9AGAM|nr:regulator of chromosome condensation 1/beta-lactamase-inhibitor protein II [Multifurca ochricompacta]
MLLAHPGISVNLQDVENHWTALHRALYNGNLSAGILLLQRSDTDTALKDVEGYRAFDLYNTTVEDTMPNKYKIPAGLELYTWGANRNASLGHGNTDDRIHPEQVVLRPRNVDGHDADERDVDSRKSETIALKLQHALVRDVQIFAIAGKKFSSDHFFSTVVVTDESRVNIRTCGFASTGRLGPGGGQHTQPSLSPIIQLASDVKITAIAVGQDHTLALTSDGVVFSWGLGRFSQLGYDVPAPHVQSSPRVISGPLRRERVRGVAACKSASACWTDNALFTWGKNNGQLGYDKNASPVQPIPRVVTKVTKPVISVALNDTAMASRTITTAQVFCNESMFSTVSSAGEIFTFNVPTPPAPGERPIPVQPQRVWALRKQWSAVHVCRTIGSLSSRLRR